MPEDDLDKLIEELREDDSISTLNEEPSAKRLNISDENVNDYIMQKVIFLLDLRFTKTVIQSTKDNLFEVFLLSGISRVDSKEILRNRPIDPI